MPDVGGFILLNTVHFFVVAGTAPRVETLALRLASMMLAKYAA